MLWEQPKASAWGPGPPAWVPKGQQGHESDWPRIWFLSAVIPCRDGRSLPFCAHSLICTHKELHYVPGSRHAAVVSYTRKVFCLDCRTAPQPPLASPTVHMVLTGAESSQPFSERWHSCAMHGPAVMVRVALGLCLTLGAWGKWECCR